MSHKLGALLLGTLLAAGPACKNSESPNSNAPGPAAKTPEPAAKTPEPEAEATAPKKPEVATRLVTADFSAPIPTGYQIFPKDKLAGLAAQMGQKVDGVLTKPKAAPDHFVTSIAFVAVQSSDVNPESVCAEIATAMAKAVGAKAQPPKQVEFPFGKTCQFEMGDEKQQAIQTIAYLGKKFWTVTCNFDRRDKASPKECNEVLTGFAALK